MPTSVRRGVLGVAFVLACGSSLAAQSPSPMPGLAPTDSTATDSAALDSTAVAGQDSAWADHPFAEVDRDTLAVAAETASAFDLVVIRPDWIKSPSVGPAHLTRARAQTMAEAIALLPRAVVRTAGAEGSVSFVGLDAISGAAPELLYDGVPSRSPADADPGLWDRSVIAVQALDDRGHLAPDGFGDPAIRAETDPALRGRTLMRTHFTSTDRESYSRGISVTTPHAPRVLRLDFEEWKTEEGFLFTGSSLSPTNFGKAKMRRFRVGAEFASDVGRTSFAFGRGRRFHRGGLATSDGSVERWTGELSVGWDRQDESTTWRARAYHLNWHDDDTLVDEARDASRLGLRLERRPRSAGIGVSLEVERWFAAFNADGMESHPDPPYVARLGGTWRSPAAGGWTVQGAAEAAYAEHSSESVGLGGGGELAYRGSALSLAVGANRRLRTPTLLETDGIMTREVATGSLLRHLGSGAVPLERQDRGYLSLETQWGELRVAMSASVARLTDGIGWTAPSGLAQGMSVDTPTRGGLELTVPQVTGSVSYRLGSPRTGAFLQVAGHQLLTDLSLSDAGHRGAGWPLNRADAWLEVWRQVASPYNQLGLVARTQWFGEHYDDLLATFPNTSPVPGFVRVDLRFFLKVRDAEIYLAVDNVTDQPLVDVLGTLERPRQLRWGLAWPFYN